MGEIDLNRDLVCVLFPGIVNNDEKALQCLGGIKNISQVYSQPKKKRLGLSYQPENPYVKRIFADTQTAAGVLLKVRVKKKKVGSDVQREIISTSIFGRVKKIYRFESMCDFQYMPVHREGKGSVQCLLDKILPSGRDSIDVMSTPCPLLIVPNSFTRSDKPISYAYTDKRYGEKRTELDDEGTIHRRLRVERGRPLTRHEFNLIDDLPTEPHEYFLKQKAVRLSVYSALEEEFQIVKKLFEERPIWSQNQIRYQTKIKLSSVKVILPCLSIYMRNGPWRMMWIRFGYDPRKEPGARFYQTLDFRLRHQAGVHSMVMTRDRIMHYKKSDRVKHNPKQHLGEALLGDDINEGAVYFRPGMAPTQRQIYYQYCDIKLPEVEEMLAIEPPPGYLCHHKRGWLSPNTDEICRDHIFRYVKLTLLATQNTDLKFEQGESSEEGSNSDDDASTSSDGASNSNT
ncbi:general transcription factor 3C polypeptide 5 [Hyposmocoma kahamanoa]|uniref:general transcription factor 3C polypeptide 5 n=1 Tax=Hyposmocoma kahamanoa TaxID=1477025 RepID=UPI000E6D624D|nr:general transcription factor 3C polypeptide 5 [Hyposmocoma kahamanoa]